MNTRSKLGLRHFLRKLSPCFVTTCASQFMTAVLLHVGLDLRKFNSLVSIRIGSLRTVLRVQGSAASNASMWVMNMDLVHLFNRTQLSFMALISLLTSGGARGFFFLGLTTLGPSDEGGLEEFVESAEREAVRHPRQRRWLDELGRLKGGRPT